MTRMLALAIFALAFPGATLYAQDHEQHSKAASLSDTSWADASSKDVAEEAKDAKDDTSIFCPTMKTGQLCSHGTASVLETQGEKHDQWILFAKKYNKALDAATLELFKDAEGVLTPKQLTKLKAWFAVGLNPQINELLNSKGLGPQKK